MLLGKHNYCNRKQEPDRKSVQAVFGFTVVFEPLSIFRVRTTPFSL